MKIIRNGQEIELTSAELQQAYEEQHREYFGMDVCDQLQECYDINPNRGDIDWERITLNAMDLLYNDDCYYECYWDAVHTSIKQYFKEKGINYETAK